MYESGACKRPPRSAIAMTAIEFGRPFATRFVPSTGSTAMSTSMPPRPSSSPMKSIGASSRSPSPMTMRPEMCMSLSASRIFSTAAPSAMFRSPRPIQREALSAASSVTRTKSSESVGYSETKRGIIAVATEKRSFLEGSMLARLPGPACVPTDAAFLTA
jgi:hypothetical protein